jgi:hypothetical protein
MNTDDPEWFSLEANLHAVHVTQDQSLIILTNDALNREKKAQLNEEKEELKGF